MDLLQTSHVIKEANIEWNVLQSLDSVPLLAIRCFSTRSLRFMDAYRKGLNDAGLAEGEEKRMAEESEKQGMRERS
ncbi:hypothetical protein BDR07DRAFT_1486598 [Suillus spraguei]|nr:hypothetical protein BDR07DRAFT_1486598 [Suillus spraguei]